MRKFEYSNVERDNCNITLDCDIYGVVRECFEKASFTNDTFFCDCSVWFGWKGLDCDEVSFALLFNRYSSILLITYASLLVVLTGRSVVLNYLMSFNPKEGIDPIIFAGIFLFISSLCLLIAPALALPAFINPDQFILYQERTIIFDSEFVVDNKFGEVSNVFYQLLTFFLSLSTVSVLLSWEKLFIKLKRFKSPEEVKTEKRLRLVLILVYFVFCTVVAGFLAARYLVASIALVVVITTIASIVLIVFSIKFVKTVKSITTYENKQVEDMVKLVRRICILASSCTVTIGLSFLVYRGLDNGIEERHAPGDFNHVLFVQHLGVFFSLIYVTLLAWYVNSVTEGAIMADICPYLCFVFRLWDRKNKSLMPDDEEDMELYRESL